MAGSTARRSFGIGAPGGTISESDGAVMRVLAALPWPAVAGVVVTSSTVAQGPTTCEFAGGSVSPKSCHAQVRLALARRLLAVGKSATNAA
jgi:hypothetical protein